TCAASLRLRARPMLERAAIWSRPSPSACRVVPAWRSCSAHSSFMAWCLAPTCSPNISIPPIRWCGASRSPIYSVLAFAFTFSGQLAKLATLRYTLIMPCVLSLIYIGAFEHSRNWGDLYSLLFFGLLGWAMKHFRWPRPPLVLGFILGSILERYMFISIERY